MVRYAYEKAALKPKYITHKHVHTQTRRKNKLTILAVRFGAPGLLNAAFGNGIPKPGENVKVLWLSVREDGVIVPLRSDCTC